MFDANQFARLTELTELIEKERDDARETAAESARHVEAMEKKLGDATSFLNGWKNGRKTTETFGT